MAEEIIKTIKVTEEVNFASDWMDDNYLVGIVHQECVLCAQHIDAYNPLYNTTNPSNADWHLSRNQKRTLGWSIHLENYRTFVGISDNWMGSGTSYFGTYNWNYKELIRDPNVFIGDPHKEIGCSFSVSGSSLSGYLGIERSRSYFSQPKPRALTISKTYGVYSRHENLQTHWFTTDSPVEKFEYDTVYSVRGKDRLADFSGNELAAQRTKVVNGEYDPDAIYMGDAFEVYDMLISVEAVPQEKVQQANISQYPHRFNAVNEANYSKSFTFDKDRKQDFNNSGSNFWAHKNHATRNGFFRVQKNGRHVYPVVSGVEYMEKETQNIEVFHWNHWLNNVATSRYATTELKKPTSVRTNPDGSIADVVEPQGRGTEFLPGDDADKHDCPTATFTVDEEMGCVVSSFRSFTDGLNDGIYDSIGVSTFNQYYSMLEDAINKNEDFYPSTNSEYMDTYNSIKEVAEKVRGGAQLSSFDEDGGTNPNRAPEKLITINSGGLPVWARSEIMRSRTIDIPRVSGFLRWYYGEEIWEQFKHQWQVESGINESQLSYLKPTGFGVANFKKYIDIPSIMTDSSEVVLDDNGNPVHRGVTDNEAGLISGDGIVMVVGERYKLFEFNVLSATCPCSGLSIPLFFNSLEAAAEVISYQHTFRQTDIIESYMNEDIECSHQKNMSASELNYYINNVERGTYDGDHNIFDRYTPESHQRLERLYKMSKDWDLRDVQFPTDRTSTVTFGDSSTTVPGDTIPQGEFVSWHNKDRCIPDWFNNYLPLSNKAGTSKNSYVTDDNGNPIWKCFWPARPNKSNTGEPIEFTDKQQGLVGTVGSYFHHKKNDAGYLDRFGRNYNDFTHQVETRASDIVSQGEKLVLGLEGRFPHNTEIRAQLSSDGTYYGTQNPVFSYDNEDKFSGVIQVNFYEVNADSKGNMVGFDPAKNTHDTYTEGWFTTENSQDIIPSVEGNNPVNEAFSLTANSWDIGKETAICLEPAIIIEPINQYPRVLEYTVSSALDMWHGNPMVLSSFLTNCAVDAHTKDRGFFSGLDTFMAGNLGFGLGFGQGDGTWASLDLRLSPGAHNWVVACYVQNNELTTFAPYGIPKFINYLNLTNPNLLHQPENRIHRVINTDTGEQDPFSGAPIIESTYEYNGQTCEKDWYSFWPDVVHQGTEIVEPYDWPKQVAASSTSGGYNLFLNTDRPWRVAHNHSDYAGRINPQGRAFFDTRSAFDANGYFGGNPRPEAEEYVQHVNLKGYVKLPYYNHNGYGVFKPLLREADFCNGSNHGIIEGSMFEEYSQWVRVVQTSAIDELQNVIITNPNASLLLRNPTFRHPKMYRNNRPTNVMPILDPDYQYPNKYHEHGFNGVISPVMGVASDRLENIFWNGG